MVVALGLLASLVGAVGVGVHFVGPVSDRLIRIASFVPWLVLVGVVGALLLLAARSWVLAAVASLVAIVGVATYAPLYVADGDQPGAGRVAGAPLTLLQTNIRLGEADPDALVRMIAERDVDLVTVQELTFGSVERLDAAGIGDLLPYRFTAPKEDGSGGGTGIYSRYPVTDGEVARGFAMANVTARLDVDGREVAVAALHPLPPFPEPAWRWAGEMERIGDVLTGFAADGAPVVVCGDFNSTWSHTRYRALLTDGYRDAADLSGAGFVPTYPTDSRIPALVGIDHVVVRDTAVSSFERVSVAGSDHAGLLVTVTPTFDAG
ncbi:endonuclease/exonuclease/phosphatase family protein [Rhodococcus rhodnii]|uniref:Transmembrane protein n=2 Tax=Rhodococcus rhodnii TaxID=38312 RepID=R7WJX8_9NOCA|nr:endonuclease/exonuclease/phosphatase family protein [Rhodococcus rhodnii]EOM75626.1 transmembrane protein [Rhodococcus rhodnii LMG 5362]TXG91858.1 endonuclease/exonuclease/phosphatase family protein [Rhodococcus rhodnii]